MWAKICANTNLADAQKAIDAGADAVGFVFAPSKRRVTAEQVAAITSALRGAAERVGVFHGGSAHEMIAAARTAGLTAVQVHSAVDPVLLGELAAALDGVKLIQTVPYGVDAADAAAREAADAAFVDALTLAFSQPQVWAVLVDAAKSGGSGGLGIAFDWVHAGHLVRETQAKAETSVTHALPHVLLAGGLNPDNVGRAIAEFSPWGVDVASGVEREPGSKDPAAVSAFVSRAKAAKP
jgi:phosphoribosylanthranilate isomerase